MGKICSKHKFATRKDFCPGCGSLVLKNHKTCEICDEPKGCGFCEKDEFE